MIANTSFIRRILYSAGPGMVEPMPSMVAAEPPVIRASLYSRGAIWSAFAATVAVIVGSVGPWTTMAIGSARGSVSGIKSDGQLTVALGIVAAILVFSRVVGRGSKGSEFVALFCLVVIIYIGATEWNDRAQVSHALDEIDALAQSLPRDNQRLPNGMISNFEVGWGLKAMTIGASIGAAGLIAHRLFESRAGRA